MAARFRIATFNCENLFARYNFKQKTKIEDISHEGWDINQTRFEVHDHVKRKITGRAVRSLDADVVVFQEVENMEVLKRFRSGYLGGFKAYPHLMVVDGNDPRLIDVAVASRVPIIAARSHQQRKESPSRTSFIFSRDCLEVDVLLGDTVVTLFVNHLKSMMGGRAQTRPRRELQSAAVRQVVEERFDGKLDRRKFIILGDLNDYLDSPGDPGSGIAGLVGWDEVENVVERLPDGERWTHFYNGANEYRQLDYLLVSRTLARKVKKVEIERRGLPLRAVRYTGPRFPGVGNDRPKASDHCPVLVEIEL